MSNITEFMGKLHDALIENGKSPKTSKTYLSYLYMLNNKQPFKSLSFLRKTSMIMDRISPYAMQTQKSILGTVVGILNLNPKGYKKAIKFYREQMTESIEECKKQDGKMTKKQEKNWLKWDEIIEKKNELDNLINNNTRKILTKADYNKILNHFVLSLYTDLPPRRNEYMYCMIVKNMKKHDDVNLNYLDLEGERFIFNKYKTQKRYGRQELSFKDNEEFKKTLTRYLKIHPLFKTRIGMSSKIPLLVKGDGKIFQDNNSITRCLNSIFKPKKISSSMIRHIYLTNKYGDVKKEMEEDAELMGHNRSTQQNKYVLKKEEEEANLENVKS